MKIERIIVLNYRSIESDCELVLNPKSTVLVGQSNVGKSNILKAINFAFNNKRLGNEEYCSWNRPKGEDDCITILFNIEEKDRPNLKKISDRLENKEKLILNKKVNGKVFFSFIPKDEEITEFIPTQSLIDKLTNIRARVRRMIRNWKDIEISNNINTETDEICLKFDVLEKWVNKLKSLYVQPSEDEQKTELKNLISQLETIRDLLNSKDYKWINARGVKRSISNISIEVNEYIPRIKYKEQKIRDYESDKIYKLLPHPIFLESDDELPISDSIAFDDLETTSSDHFIKQLLNISDIDLNIFKGTDVRLMEEELESGNEKLSKRLAKYWKQEEIKIILRRDFDESSKIPKKILVLDLKGKEGHRGSITHQSPGFRWFLAFVVKYLVSSNSGEKDVFLILDEPGIHLHAAAQYDLLDRFEQTSENLQIIYTTHSPYMINKNFPYRILSVEKGSTNEQKEKQRGTYVNLKPYHSEKGRAWEPIRSAIGLPAGASLYVAGNNLIVEGITDQIILSGVIQAINKVSNKTKFDLNKVCICFGGDTPNLVALSIFCHQETQSAKVLLDTDTAKVKIEKLKRAKFPEDRIFVIGEVISKKEKYIDIEDLFDTEFYQNCFLKAYNSIPGFIGKNTIPKSWQEIYDFIQKKYEGNKNIDVTKWGHSKYYEMYFKGNENKLGNFDKVIVSRIIAEDILNLDEIKAKKMLYPFDKILTKIWGKDPNWN